VKEVIEETVRMLDEDEPCVLATVVRTKGMTPQKAGAKQLFREDGSSVGTLGGGCVEGDIWFLAKQMFKDRSGPQLREYYLNEDVAAKDGLVCGGTMFFYVEHLHPESKFLPVAKEILSAYTGGSPMALATTVSHADKNREIGQKLVVPTDGPTVGSLGEEKLHQEAIRVGRKIAPFAKNQYLKGESGMEVYVEGFTSPPTLVLMGGGHVGRAIYEAALPLGFRIFVADDRPEFSNKQRFPLAEETVVAGFDKALEQIPVHPNTFLIVATRGHKYDDRATKAAVSTSARYIGLLGSRRKNLMIFRDLRKEGVAMERIQNINAPVGLDIGALSPEEIAVSIVAEIIMVLRGGAGGSLKMSDDDLPELIKKVPESKKPTLPF
jgi:xanthine dehydrogenase accessory factor